MAPARFKDTFKLPGGPVDEVRVAPVTTEPTETGVLEGARAMDGIGPILGVRAVTMRKPDRPAPDLSRVFEAEYLGDAPEDSDSREENALDGDLEEPRVTLADTADSPGRSGDDAPPSSIDCFA